MYLLFCIAAFTLGQNVQAQNTEMVRIPEGTYVPFFLNPSKKEGSTQTETQRLPVKVKSFFLDRYPVTRSEYLEFVKQTPKWRKSKVTRLLADPHYLENWRSDLTFSGNSKSPITHVSWFAAQAYCEWQGKTLPTTDQWEYVVNDQGKNTEANKARILAWYGKPNPVNLGIVGSTPANSLGVSDLYGLIWEWTLDFNSNMISDESRSGGTLDENLFCGSGSQGALDPSDYAKFMRYSFRSSLKASYTTRNLGFRCAKADGDSIYQADLVWTDQDGKKVALKDFRGKPVVLAMVYTTCQASCPLIVSDMKKIADSLSTRAREQTHFALFSFDSEQDMPAQLKKFAEAHALDPKQWTLLTAPQGTVRTLAALLGVKYKKETGKDFSHSNIITVLDPEGTIKHQQIGLRQNPEETVRTVSSFIQ